MNHTTIGIAAILTLAALTAGAFAVTSAYAGGHGHDKYAKGDHDSKYAKGDHDSISIKSLFNQKNICWSVDDSRTTCRNTASVFGNNNNGEEDNGMTGGTG